MPFEVTTAVKKMLRLQGRKKVIQGATSSGKTYGIIPICADRCLEKKIKATVVAESVPALKDGAVKIFKDFMEEEGRWNDMQWIGNPMEYTFRNGSILQFKSFDSIGKAKAAGKRELLFMNEGNHIPWEIADALMIRSKETIIDFNADAEFWAHTEVLKQPSATFLKLTYLDNEAIPEETLEDMLYRKQLAEAEDAAGMRGYWWNWWQVYGLGEIGSLQGVVFSNWTTIERVPPEARLKGYGLDFGFTNDPTALVAIYEYNGQKIWDEVIYRKGLSNSELSATMKAEEVSNHVAIYADSADPKSITELMNYGHFIMGAGKGPDSVRFGINLVQDGQFLVTERSRNIIKELRNYTWLTDQDGKSTNKPIDAWNHSCDAARYWYMENSKQSEYIIM